MLEVDESNGNPKLTFLRSEPIRSIVVIKLNLIGHYLVGLLKGQMRDIETSPSCKLTLRKTPPK